MRFKLVRTYNSNSTIGELFTEDGSHFCYTIERSSDDQEHPCVNESVYKLTRYNSPEHGEVWKLEDRDGRTYIEIHICKHQGEYLDYVRWGFLLGCIGLGDKYCIEFGQDAVCGSVEAFNRFMVYTKDETEMELEITS